MQHLKRCHPELIAASDIIKIRRSSFRNRTISSCGIVYHYLNGNSKQFRTVVLFKERDTLERELLSAKKEVMERDPAVDNVIYLDVV